MAAGSMSAGGLVSTHPPLGAQASTPRFSQAFCIRTPSHSGELSPHDLINFKRPHFLMLSLTRGWEVGWGLVSVYEFWKDTYIPSRHGTKADAPLLTQAVLFFEEGSPPRSWSYVFRGSCSCLQINSKKRLLPDAVSPRRMANA